MSTRLTASVRIPLIALQAFKDTYGIKDANEIPREAIRLLEDLNPSAFKYQWVLDWPKKQKECVVVTKSIPKIVWNNLKTKWGTDNPSALLRTGLYVMYAKRHEQNEWEQVVQQVLTPEQPVVPIGLETAD